MKTFSLLLAVLVLTSCSSDNEPVASPVKSTPGATSTEFVVEGQAYVTPNAYLLLDDAIGDYDREFSFVFTDGLVIEDPVDGIAFEATTTYITKITCNLIATVPTQAQLPIFVWPSQNPTTNIIMEGNNYTYTNIGSFNVTNNVGGIDYGQIELADGYEHTAQPQGNIDHPTHLFTVESLTVDLTTGTGTIRCRYNYDDDNGINISGVYVGAFEILTAF